MLGVWRLIAHDRPACDRLSTAVRGVVMFHMTFPSLTVGLSLFLIGMYAAYVVAVAGRADCLPGSRH